MSAVIEREVKLSAWPGFRLPDLDGVATGARTRRRETVDLDATYFDTADLRLGRRGITLRHRRRGARETWTLKLPVESSDPAILARSEIDVTGPPGDVPAELALLVAAEVRTATLVKVARLMTVRRRTLVLDRDDMPLAEIDDDEVSVMDGGRVAARFRELEVEIAPDVDDEVARRVVDRLVAGRGRARRRACPSWPAPSGPGSCTRPRPRRATCPPSPPPVDVVAAALRAGATRLIEHHPAAVTGVDPEGVHQMRVGARRLRSDLRTFRPLLDRDVTDPVRDELRWLGEVLGAVRDPDVLGDQLRAVAADRPGSRRGPRCSTASSAGWPRPATRPSPRSTRSSDRTATGGCSTRSWPWPRTRRCAGRPTSRPTTVLPGLVAKPWRALRQQVDALGDEPEDAALHEVRKAAKQVRYATEAVAPVVGRPARKAAKGVRRVQDVLGDHQDTVVAEEWLRAVGRRRRHRPRAEAFALGLLVAGERARRADAAGATPGPSGGTTAPPTTGGAWLRERRRSARGDAVEVRRAPAGWWRRHDGDGRVASCSSTGPATTTGASPRASATRARATRTAPAARSRRRPGCGASWASSCPSTHYVDRKGRTKQVRYWAMEVVGGEFAPNDEVDEVRWLAPDAAVALLSYAHDTQVVAAWRAAHGDPSAGPEGERVPTT